MLHGFKTQNAFMWMVVLLNTEDTFLFQANQNSNFLVNFIVMYYYPDFSKILVNVDYICDTLITFQC